MLNKYSNNTYRGSKSIFVDGAVRVSDEDDEIGVTKASSPKQKRWVTRADASADDLNVRAL